MAGTTRSPGVAAASIRYASEQPNAVQPYPFGADRPAPPLFPGTTLYLSAAESSSGSSAPFSVLWSVVAPGGRALDVTPSPRTVRASVVVSSLGEHTLSLHVTNATDPAIFADAILRLDVEPRTCAETGRGMACEGSLPIDGATFALGSPASDGHVSEHPEHPATVAPFALDRFEVTVGRFRRFLDDRNTTAPLEGSGAHPLIAGSGWRSTWDSELATSREQLMQAFEECRGTFTREPAEREALPINCVSWYEALAFCIWDGGRLPTEAEWELAASGGSEERTYPWGNAAPEAQLAVFDCRFDGARGCSDADLAPVGNAPAGKGRFGHEDLAGSLWEWVLDRYADYGEAPCENCAALDNGQGRLFRGGDYSSDDPSLLRAATRLGFLPEYRDATRGFRCARAQPRD